jgi:hypothetical protein
MDRKGYCVHGVYVGGCGIDWMCHYCENGVSYKEWKQMLKWEAKEKRRKERQKKFFLIIVNIYTTYNFPGKKWLLKYIANLAIKIM